MAFLAQRDTKAMPTQSPLSLRKENKQIRKNYINETSYKLIVGTLLWITSDSSGRSTRIKFSPALWTTLSQGFEILSNRAFGGPQFLFRTFNIITRDHPAWRACAFGDVEELQRLFTQGLASPYDVNEDGGNLLFVS